MRAKLFGNGPFPVYPPIAGITYDLSSDDNLSDPVRAKITEVLYGTVDFAILSNTASLLRTRLMNEYPIRLYEGMNSSAAKSDYLFD